MTAHYSRSKGEVVGTTDARQANSRKTNLRVLIYSTALITLIFAGFVLAFMYATPSDMDSSSGGNLQQTNVVPHDAPTPPQAPAGQAGPSTGAATP